MSKSLAQKMSEYPKAQPPKWVSAPGRAICSDCETVLPPGRRRCAIETRVSIMRGDDEVAFYCDSCANNRGHLTPEQEKQLNRVANRNQLQAAIARMEKRLAKLHEQLEIINRKIAESK